MGRLTEREPYWLGEEFWTYEMEPTDEEIEAVYEKLRHYENLEEQGLLLRLPCKVGDTLYYITEGFIEPCTIETIYLADYKDNKGNHSYIAEIHFNREDCPYVSTDIYFTEIGKEVFFTREEAEAALHMKGDTHD